MLAKLDERVIFIDLVYFLVLLFLSFTLNLFLDSQKLRNEKMHELSSTASSDYHELMRDRRNRLYRVCKSLNLEDSKKKNYGFSWGQIFYFKRTSLLYCPVFKAGSSTWLDYIFHNSREASSVSLK